MSRARYRSDPLTSARLFIVGIICHSLSIRSREDFYFLKPSWCTNSGRLVIYRNTAAIIVTLTDFRAGWHTLSSRYQMSGLLILDEAELSRSLTCLARAITPAGVGGSLCAAQTGRQVTTACRLSTPRYWNILQTQKLIKLGHMEPSCFYYLKNWSIQKITTKLTLVIKSYYGGTLRLQM